MYARKGRVGVRRAFGGLGHGEPDSRASYLGPIDGALVVRDICPCTGQCKVGYLFTLSSFVVFVFYTIILPRAPIPHMYPLLLVHAEAEATSAEMMESFMAFERKFSGSSVPFFFFWSVQQRSWTAPPKPWSLLHL